MEMILNLNTGYAISIYIILLSTILSTLELSFVPRHYFNFVYPKLISLEVTSRRWIIIHLAQIILAVSAAGTFYFNIEFLFYTCFCLLTFLSLYSYINRKIGKDGADQVRILALLCLSFCFLLPGETGKAIALCFLGLQVLLGYMTSGVAKLLSPLWRSGKVLHLIFGTYAYGIPRIAKMLKNHPKIETIASHSSIFIMLAVPLSLAIPYPYIIISTLSAILCFHFATMVIMGLNDFFFTFPVAYPGVLLLHGILHGYVQI